MSSTQSKNFWNETKTKRRHFFDAHPVLQELGSNPLKLIKKATQPHWLTHSLIYMNIQALPSIVLPWITILKSKLLILISQEKPQALEIVISFSNGGRYSQISVYILSSSAEAARQILVLTNIRGSWATTLIVLLYLLPFSHNTDYYSQVKSKTYLSTVPPLVVLL